jgi:4-hydroxymandelate oxidase
VYGLAVGGAKGVERVINILRDELERAMALTGRRSIAEIDPLVLWRKDNSGVSHLIRRAPAGA